MPTIKITKKGLYANPSPGVPHLDGNIGDVVSVSDAMANTMCNEYEAAEPFDGEATNANDAAIELLVNDHGKNDLITACEANELDTGGTKTDLATRLVDAGITEISTE